MSGVPGGNAGLLARRLLGDRSVAVILPSGLTSAVETWVWPLEELAPATGEEYARVEVEVSRERAAPPPLSPPTFDARYVAAWIDPRGGRAVLHSADGSVAARLDLHALRARVRVVVGSGATERNVALAATLRVATALLLAAQGRALFHASAVVDGDGRAWLFAGDSHAGKTTTALTLVGAGFDYIADDQLVVYEEAGELRAAGWPRKVTLDRGYRDGVSRGIRAAADPREFAVGARIGSAPIGGLVFPRVEPGKATVRSRLGPPDALARLIRHSPWLLASRGTAGALLGRLRRLAELPAFGLRLGSDVYARPAALLPHLPGAWMRATVLDDPTPPA